jgi:predicted SnoaL-like aldol condensation-catalyzing enzyme
MKHGSLILLAGLLFAAEVSAQVPVAPAVDQEALLAGADARASANKRLVYDFWREVFEAHHLDLVPHYLAGSYIEHNPRFATGRDAFVENFSKAGPPKPIEAHIKRPLVAIVAEGDLVILSFVREAADPKDPAKKYTTTWFDMFRVADGKIAEHWDAAQLQ